MAHVFYGKSNTRSRRSAGDRAAPPVVRGDPSGLALSEYRLHVGFLHCPVPFWGSRRVSEIVRVSSAPEMSAWDVGGDYTRPICRRIVEGAGIDRAAFGVSKHAASVVLHNEAQFMGHASTERYLDWLIRQRGAWARRGRLPPIPSRRLDDAIARGSLVVGAPQLAALRRLAPYRGLERRLARSRVGPTYLRRFTFPWAMSEVQLAYPQAGDGRPMHAFAGL